MKSLTWLKYDFRAELRPRRAGANDSVVDDQYPPTGNIVSFTMRSNNSTTMRVLSPEKLELFAALVNITDREGRLPFSLPDSVGGDYWIIYHVEPIYDTHGHLIYWLQMAKRQS